MTAQDLADLLMAKLVREHGGGRRRWRIAIGDVRVYSLLTHPHCNWAVAPSGNVRENAAIERCVDDLREQHPVVTIA